jgi:hypothetical protein
MYLCPGAAYHLYLPSGVIPCYNSLSDEVGRETDTTLSLKNFIVRLPGMPAYIASYRNPLKEGLEGLDQIHLTEDCEQW